MKRNRNNQIARRLLPYVTLILSMSLAVTLRIERSCSDAGQSYDAPSLGPGFDVQGGVGAKKERQPARVAVLQR